MEIKLQEETPYCFIWVVNKEFYLVIPKIRLNPKIEIVIVAEAKIEEYKKSVNICIIRLFML